MPGPHRASPSRLSRFVLLLIGPALAAHLAAPPASAAPADLAPTVAAPGFVIGPENALLTFLVTASDPDGDAISSLTAAPLPSGATFTTNPGNTSGTFSWIPSFTQAGIYSVTFTAANALQGSATTTVQVGGPERPPVVTAPLSEAVQGGSPLTFTVSAGDPDGDAIASLIASPLPSGAKFTVNPSNTSGTFAWTPTNADAGTHTVSFTACNALCGTASTQIQVSAVDHPPVVTAPASVLGVTGVLLQFDVFATDPDGDPIFSLGMVGGPPRAQFVPDPDNHHAVFSWIPSASDAGTWIVTFVASNALSGTATTAISVNLGGPPPVVTAPATETVNEGATLVFGVSASAADGGHVTLTALSLPLGATFTDNGDNTGTFLWVPGFTQSGDYSVQFRGVDAAGLSSTATTAIHVDNTNRPPVADAGGPYQGVVALPISFDGSGSTDPDGDALSYLWSFGDGGTGTGVTLLHAYASVGTYTVTLQVTDPSGLSSIGATSATILTLCQATLFQAGGYKTLRLGSGKPAWCTEIEPVGGCFTVDEVIASSIVLEYPPGTVPGIPAMSKNTSLGGDLNGNGIEEITACFSKDALRTLFAALPSGENIVTVRVEGALTTGGRFAANGVIHVFGTGGALAASVTPTPLRSSGELEFQTSRTGALRVRLYDIHGRLVRTLLDQPAAPPGGHGVSLDGRDSRGVALPAGIYFYAIETPGALSTGRLVIAR